MDALVEPSITPLYRNTDFEGQPWAVTASTTFVGSGERAPNTAALINNTKQMVEVSEIRFTLLGGSAFDVSPAGMSVKLSMGKLMLTAGYVPMALFNRFVNNAGEQVINNGSVIFKSMSQCVWRLPLPIYIPAGSVLTPEFKGSGYTGNNLTARVTYLGRTTKQRAADKFRFPFVTAFNALPSLAARSILGSDIPAVTKINKTGDELSLINVTSSPLKIAYLTGRLMQTQLNAELSNTQNSVYMQDMLDPIFDSIAFIRITTSEGYEVVRNFSPFNVVFNTLERYFPCELTLPAGGFLQVDFQFNAPSPAITTDSSFSVSQIIAQIGMVGSYGVDLSVPEVA